MRKTRVPPIYFKLTVEDTLKVLNTYIKPYYPNITYLVRKSDISNSIYVEFYRDDMKKIVRLSDHPIKNMKYNYISKRTRYNKVVSIFNNVIKGFDRTDVLKYFDKIKEERTNE